MQTKKDEHKVIKLTKTRKTYDDLLGKYNEYKQALKGRCLWMCNFILAMGQTAEPEADGNKGGLHHSNTKTKGGLDDENSNS